MADMSDTQTDSRSDWLHARADESREMVRQVAGRYRLPQKITLAADSRMRTYRAQQAADLADLERGPDDVVPDADDSALQRGMLT